MNQIYVYQCVNRACVAHHKEFEAAMGPAAARLATGGPVRCPTCSAPVQLLKVKPEQELPSQPLC